MVRDGAEMGNVLCFYIEHLTVTECYTDLLRLLPGSRCATLRTSLFRSTAPSSRTLLNRLAKTLTEILKMKGLHQDAVTCEVVLVASLNRKQNDWGHRKRKSPSSTKGSQELSAIHNWHK